MKNAKPKCEIVGETMHGSSEIIAKARQALEDAGQRERALEMQRKAYEVYGKGSASYDEVVLVCEDYVELHQAAATEGHPQGCSVVQDRRVG